MGVLGEGKVKGNRRQCEHSSTFTLTSIPPTKYITILKCLNWESTHRLIEVGPSYSYRCHLEKMYSDKLYSTPLYKD